MGNPSLFLWTSLHHLDLSAVQGGIPWKCSWNRQSRVGGERGGPNRLRDLYALVFWAGSFSTRAALHHVHAKIVTFGPRDLFASEVAQATSDTLSDNPHDYEHLVGLLLAPTGPLSDVDE